MFASTILVEIQSWMDAIETNKIIYMSRRLEDNEASSIQLAHRVEQQDVALHSLEMLLQESKASISDLQLLCEDLKSQLASVNSHVKDLKLLLKENESERLMLLKSRGVVPKVLPLWALSENPREGVVEIIDKVKIWTGTWNLGSKEPFTGMDKNRAQRLLQPFVPVGYDIYVLGVQDCLSESVFECLEGLLQAEGCRRMNIDLDSSIATEGNRHANGNHTSSATTSAGISVDASKILGRTDGSLLSSKFTGIAVFVRSSLLGDVRTLATTNYAFATSQSKGAVAVALSVLGRTVVFVNSHWDSKHTEKKRDHFQLLTSALGSQLGETGFLLNEQFHHIVWMGDLNYRLVDTSGNPMPVESVVKMLEDKRLCRTLFESHDQLLQERRSQAVFYGFREPVPFPNFYPTYKKIEGRNPVDYGDPSWVRSTYRIQHKQPFYKGGAIKETTPGFCDRVLYHSISDLAEDLLPECVPTEMLVSNSSPASSITEGGPKTVKFTVDNYRSLNDGEAMTVSDHSPVFATFILRVRHDYEQLLKDAIDKKTSEEGIQTVFTALGITDLNPSPVPKKKSPSLLLARDETAETDDLAASESFSKQSVIYKYSLLAPGGWHRVRLTNLKLLWGTKDEVPRYVSVMFPSPYETLAGEKFTDFLSESTNSVFDALEETRTTRSSVAGTNSSQNKGGSKAPKSSSTEDDGFPVWRKVGPSRTGTSLIVDITLPAGFGVSNGMKNKFNRRTASTGGNSNRGSMAQATPPPLVLTWRGDEPLDKLHMALKVVMPASSIGSSSGNQSNSHSSVATNSSSANSDDVVVGHCAIGLEQLCKVAVASTGGTTGTVNVARILVNSGRPMFNVDTKTMQREMVTLCCAIELLPS